VPGIWREIFDLSSGSGWEPREDVPEVFEGIDLSAAAGFDDRVDQGAAVAGIGIADEEPVLLADGGGANGVFNEVVVYALQRRLCSPGKIPAGDTAPARSTGSGSGGNK